MVLLRVDGDEIVAPVLLRFGEDHPGVQRVEAELKGRSASATVDRNSAASELLRVPPASSVRLALCCIKQRRRSIRGAPGHREIDGAV